MRTAWKRQSWVRLGICLVALCQFWFPCQQKYLKLMNFFFFLFTFVKVFLMWHKEQLPRSGSQSRPTHFIKDSLLFREQFSKNLTALAEFCSFEVGDTKCTIVVLFWLSLNYIDSRTDECSQTHTHTECAKNLGLCARCYCIYSNTHLHTLHILSPYVHVIIAQFITV